MNYLLVMVLLFSFPFNLLAQKQVACLHDKIGQMLLIGFDGTKIDRNSPIVKQIQQGNIGGVILFDYNLRTKTFDKNIQNPDQVKKLNHDLQYFNKEAYIKYKRPALPLLISIDYEGGEVSRLNERYGFPKTSSAYDIGRLGPDKAEDAAKVMAITLKNAGFNLNFGPVLDVNFNPDNPIIGKMHRSFSNDPATVSRYATIYSQQFSNNHIQSVCKHFPGHGSSIQDSHLGFVDVTNSWTPDELLPYKQLISSQNALRAVMSAHIVNKKLDPSGKPATLSYDILTKLLRNQLHFKGVIITDDLQMRAIADHYGLSGAVVLAINAGADVLIFGNNLEVPPQDPGEVIRIIEAKVQSGEISEKRIDEAYERIVTLKSQLK